jgi:hypothetical protein
VPNCGLGDPNTNRFQAKDCIFNCNLFCDEWGKVSANLTSDSTIKDCKPDDACSACKSCQPGPDSPDEAAVRAAFDLGIRQTTDLMNERKEEQKEELVALKAEKDAIVEGIDDEIALIDKQIELKQEEINDNRQEISDLQSDNEEGFNDGEIKALQDKNEDLTEEIGELREDTRDLRDDIREVEDIYRENQQILKDNHKVEIDAYVDQINDLQDEKQARLKRMKNRGVCKPKTAPNRPCYCPAYIDEESGRVVDDSMGKECFLCNTENGVWEYQDELCSVTCERCVVCDGGERTCASVTVSENQANDVCVQAMNKALTRCEEYEVPPPKCPYPQESCRVEGPLPGGNFNSEVNTSNGVLTISQGGERALSTNEGIVANIRLRLEEDATGMFALEALPSSQINGTENVIVEASYISIGTDVLPPDVIIGRPTVGGPKTVGEDMTSSVKDVTTTQSGTPVWEYRWYADGAPCFWSPQRYPVDPETEQQYNPEGKYEEGDIMGETTLRLSEQDVGKLITVGIRLKRVGVPPESDYREFKKSNPYGPVQDSPAVFNQGSIEIYGAPSISSFSSLKVDISELEELFYPKYFPILIDWIATDTGASVGGSDHLFLRQFAVGRTFYAVATIIDEEGDPKTWISPAVGPIEAGGPPTTDPEPEPSTGEATIVPSGPPTEGGTVQMVATASFSNPKASGPFWRWEIAGELIYGAWNRSFKVPPEAVNKTISGSAIWYDVFGNPVVGAAEGVGPVENVPSVVTGYIWITGPSEPKEGDTLGLIQNIGDEDGFGTDNVGIQYQWQTEQGSIADATKESLELVPSLDLVGKYIRVVAYWTDDFGQDKVMASSFTEPVLSRGDTYLLKGVDIIEEKGDKDILVPIRLSGPDPDEDGGISITSIVHSWKLSRVEASSIGATFVAEAPAVPGQLAEEEWSEEVEGPECPEGWDCFKTEGQGSNRAPAGTYYLNKCPYPGYPELTYEESLEAQCKTLCEDYCYTWTYSVSDGEPGPVLDEQTFIKTVYKREGGTDYILETCVEPPEDRLDCPPLFKKNYTAIWRVATPEIIAYECNCGGRNAAGGPQDTPLGNTFTVKAAVEWSVTPAGAGPWTLDPEEGEYLPICGEGEIPALGNEGTPDTTCAPFLIPWLGCVFRPYPITQAIRYCYASRPNSGIGGVEITRSEYCGGIPGKPNPQRGFIITDDNDDKWVQYHGYSMWPYVYRELFINQVSNKEPFSRDEQIRLKGRIYNPGVPDESLPPDCVDAPTQVAYYSIADNTFFATEEIYREIVGDWWYDCFVTGVREGRQCEGCFETSWSCEVDPDFLIPFQLAFVRNARWQEIQRGDPLYANANKAVTPPAPPQREPSNEQKSPVITGPRSASYSNSDKRKIVTMKATADGTQSSMSGWRFYDNKSDVDLTGFFRIRGDGSIYATGGAIPPGNYLLKVQAQYLALWSYGASIGISVSGE